MPQPPYIKNGAFFNELQNVLDVNEIITAMTTFAVTRAAWTDEGGGRFKSPPDVDGRFFEVILTRTAALTLECQFIDDQGRSFATDALFTLISGSTITFMYGAGYLFIGQYANDQYLFGNLLTLSPDPETAHTSYTVFAADNVSGGGASGCLTTTFWQITAGSLVLDSGVGLEFGDLSGDQLSASRHVSGGLRAFAYYNVGDDGVPNNIRGRMTNAVILHVDDAPAGAERLIPLGEGTSALFKALNIPVGDDVQILLRKGS